MTITIPLPSQIPAAKSAREAVAIDLQELSDEQFGCLENDSLSQAQRDAQRIEEARKPVEKRPFVRKPHLTDRALAHHPGLVALKESMAANKDQGKPRPKPKSRRQPAKTTK